MQHLDEWHVWSSCWGTRFRVTLIWVVPSHSACCRMIRNCLKAASSKTYEALQHPENQIKWVGEMILKSKSELNDVYIYIYIYIRRPRPWPRQGRRLGPPQVWNFSFLAFQGRLPALKSHRLNIPLACFILQPTGTPRPHINVFLWASKPAVCQPLNA